MSSTDSAQHISSQDQEVSGERDLVSIVYVTHRRQPHFDWFAASLARQLNGDECEVICVDGLFSTARGAEFEAAVAGRFPFRHVPAKPSPYSGPQRLTRNEYHAPSSARNTGVVYARGAYLVFVDDSSVLMPGWWEEVKVAASLGQVVAGAYHFHWEMVVDGGVLIHSRVDPSRRTGDEPFGQDTRWQFGDDEKVVPCPGDHVYGGNFGVPRWRMLHVNGSDELCDTMRGQDYHLGLRLEWSGARIVYSRRMLLIKSEERHAGENTQVIRLNHALDRALYMERLRERGVTHRTTTDAWDSRNLVLDILHGTRMTRSLGNYYELAELDEAGLTATTAGFPDRYWVDGRPLSEM